MLYSYMTQEQLSHETGNEYSRSTRDLANVTGIGRLMILLDFKSYVFGK